MIRGHNFPYKQIPKSAITKIGSKHFFFQTFSRTHHQIINKISSITHKPPKQISTTQIIINQFQLLYRIRTYIAKTEPDSRLRAKTEPNTYKNTSNPSQIGPALHQTYKIGSNKNREKVVASVVNLFSFFLCVKIFRKL